MKHSVDDNIFAPLAGLSTLAKELTVVTYVMLSFSNELSTLVFESIKCKQMKVNTKCVKFPS